MEDALAVPCVGAGTTTSGLAGAIMAGLSVSGGWDGTARYGNAEHEPSRGTETSDMRQSKKVMHWIETSGGASRTKSTNASIKGT
jgi:hypothetical protein